MSQNQPICSNPKIVIHPLAAEFVFRFRHYYAKGKKIIWRGRSFGTTQDMLKFHLNPHRTHVTLETIEDYYCVDDNGELIPLYLAVPCGQCPNCIMSKQSSFVQRATFETMSHDTFPWFVTLTYSNAHLPWNKQLSVHDVQLFLKRFRQRLKRDFQGRYDFPLRYAVTGEYGKKGRPHYHLILWNIHSYTHRDYLNVLEMIHKSWCVPNSDELIGWITARVVNPSTDDKCFKYTTKYLCKPFEKQHLPHLGAKRPFLNSSRGRLGSIGKTYSLKILSDCKSLGFSSPNYVNKWNGHIKDVYINKWVIDSWYPSKSRLIPSNVRKALLELSCDLLNENENVNIYQSVRDLLDVYRQHFYDPFFISGADIFYKCKNDWQTNQMICCQWLESKQFYTYQQISDYFFIAEKSQSDRHLFLAYQFAFAPDIDIKARHQVAYFDISRQISNEIL